MSNVSYLDMLVSLHFYTLCTEWLMGTFLWQLSSEQGQLETLARHLNRRRRTYKRCRCLSTLQSLLFPPCFFSPLLLHCWNASGLPDVTKTSHHSAPCTSNFLSCATRNIPIFILLKYLNFPWVLLYPHLSLPSSLCEFSLQTRMRLLCLLMKFWQKGLTKQSWRAL